ncbi:MAG TPA: PPE domain-containing protein [Actinophytocola sp.]|jgi:uncharacterized protein YukE|uniref:WXG100 family type VII secretion target n=1 Tax=Actinophytocola sp. TaxID=1872138 RepID=UPI002DFC9CED|nr:PPE domain-containing protein [Actinophytocola sp.]
MGTARQRHMRRLREGNKKAAAKGAFPRIRWEGYGHHDLYNMIHATPAEHLHDMAGGWRTLGKSIDETTKAVQRSLNKLSANWLGAASAQAGQSSEKITRWAEELADKSHEIGDGLHQYADAVHHAQRVMPPPEFAYAEAAMMHGEPTDLVQGPAGQIEFEQFIDDQKPNFEKHHEVYQEAIRVMKNYGAHSQTVHDELPMLPEAPPPRSTTPTTQPGPIPWTEPFPKPIPKPLPEPKPGDDGADGSGGPSTGSDGGTTAAAVDPTRSGLGWGNQPGTGPGYGLDSTRGGQGTAFGVGGGFAGGPGAQGVGGEGAAGRPGAGSLSARGGEFGARGAAGLGGARGAGGPGAGSLYPPVAGAGAPGEDDQEHKDKYNEGLDLFDDLPPAYPPVFGA